MKLEGNISYLVPFDDSHLNSKEYMSWLRDYDVMKTINRLDYLRPVSFYEVREYCEGVMRSKNDIFMAIYHKDGNEFIGTLRVKIGWETRTADVGIMIGEKDYWGKGIGTDAVSTICGYLFERLAFRRLTAGLMGVNLAMLRVFERVGFQREGVFRMQDYYEGKYVDHIYLGCFREEYKPN